jgi:hypothetical protein
MGFMDRLRTLCSLPRTEPNCSLQYKRQNKRESSRRTTIMRAGVNKIIVKFDVC